MKQIKKTLAGIVLGVSLLSGGAYNISDYSTTMNRLKEVGNWYSNVGKEQAEKELEKMEGNYNPLKLGYKMALKDYIRYCVEAENVGVI